MAANTTHAYTKYGDNFIPEIWAGTVLRTLENNLVATKICSQEYEGQLKQAGDTVHFGKLADPTIRKYEDSDDSGAAPSIVYEELSGSNLDLKIDQQNYFAFNVNDIEKAQAKVDLQNSQANRAAYRLRDECDKYVLALAKDTSITNVVSDESLDSASVLSSIGMMSQKLDEANVPNEQKWIVITPAVKLKLSLAGIKFGIAEGINGKTGVEWTKELGFNLYVSNNIAKTTASSTDTYYCFGGSKNALGFAEQIMDTEIIRRESRFTSAVRGLHVFGAKILKPAELVVGKFVIAAETAI